MRTIEQQGYRALLLPGASEGDGLHRWQAYASACTSARAAGCRPKSGWPTTTGLAKALASPTIPGRPVAVRRLTARLSGASWTCRPGIVGGL